MVSSDHISSNGVLDGQVATSYVQVEDHLRKKARLTLTSPPSPTHISEVLSVGSAADKCVSEQVRKVVTEEVKTDQAPTGRWSLDEKLLFLYGLSLFGKGRWKKIHLYVPDRSLVQIKSHAQKVLKRVDNGENVFTKLAENRDRLKELVAEANRTIEAKEAQAKIMNKKRKRAPPQPQKPPKVIAAPPSPTAVDSPFDLIQRRSSSTARSRKAEDAPSASSIPTPSASSADPPGVHVSQCEHSAYRLQAARSNTARSSTATQADGVPSNAEPPKGGNGTGAVIAAVAALCQLSSRADP